MYSCPLYIFLTKLHTNVKHYEAISEHMNPNTGLPTFGVIALWTLNIAISTMYSCPLSKLKTIQDIIMKFLTNVKHHKNCNSG